jgi:hypothetical protein
MRRDQIFSESASTCAAIGEVTSRRGCRAGAAHALDKRALRVRASAVGVNDSPILYSTDAFEVERSNHVGITLRERCCYAE